MYREGASNKVTFEQRLEGSDGVIYVGSGKVISQIETEAVMQVCVSGERQVGGSSDSVETTSGLFKKEFCCCSECLFSPPKNLPVLTNSNKLAL